MKRAKQTVLYTYADLGAKPNLKTEEAAAIISAVSPSAVFGRTVPKTKGYQPLLSGGAFIPKLFGLVNRISQGRIPTSQLMYPLIDRSTASRTVAADIVIFHPYTFAETCKIYRNAGAFTVMIGTSACGPTPYRLAQEQGVTTRRPEKFFVESLRSADHIIAYSRHVKRTYMELGIPEERISVVPIGVDTKRFVPKRRSRKRFTVVSVADFTALKGVQYLLEAWKRCRVKGELILVGNRDNHIEALLDQYDVTVVDHTDPLPYYLKADLFVLPSLTEGFGKVYLEALSCGVPVIATENTGVADILTDGKEGFIIPIKDSRQLEDHLSHLAKQPAELERMSRNARKLALAYGWEQFSERFRRAINNAYRKRKENR